MEYEEIDNNGIPDSKAQPIPPGENSFEAGRKALEETMDKIGKIESGESEPEEPKTEEPEIELKDITPKDSKDDPELDIDLDLDSESEEKPKEKPEKKDWKEKKRYFKSKEKKRSFQLEAEREELRNAADALYLENERLKKELEESVYSGAVQYGKNAYDALERAKENRKAALEDGDTQDILESDISLANAIQNVRELEAWAARRDREMEEEKYLREQPQYDQPQYNQPQYNQPQYKDHQYDQLQYNQPQLETDLNTRALHEWVSEHPEVNPKSKRYNEKIAEEMTKFSSKLDEKLYKDNNMDAFFTPKYFKAIDNHFEKVSDKFLGRKKSNSANPYVGGVKGGRSAATAVKRAEDIKLNELELSMAEHMNISPENWKKSKMELARLDRSK